MDSTEKQEHARRIVAEYLDDNLEFSYVYEDEDLEDHEDAWRDIHNLCGEIIKDLRLGRILGLAQALAIIRSAPNRPSAEQVKAISLEFAPDD